MTLSWQPSSLSKWQGKKYYGEEVDGLEESRRFKNMMQEFSECTRVTNLGICFPFCSALTMMDLRQDDPAGAKGWTLSGKMMLVAGTKTSAMSLEWAFSNMLNNPHVLKKGMGEVDTQKERVSWRSHGSQSDKPGYGQLLQCFEFTTVDGKEIDMTETAATLMVKITPLELMCKARPNTHNLLA
uniref:Uncharacterized protein n=1 Tax=Salix viminalis TaxID=40686 RepID=A0A6N2MYF1_SALVM